MLRFGGTHSPSTLLVPNGESAWIRFESRGLETARGFVIELGLQEISGGFQMFIIKNKFKKQIEILSCHTE